MITLLLLAGIAAYYIISRSTTNQNRNTDQFGRQREYARNDEPEILDKGQTNGRSRHHVN